MDLEEEEEDDPMFNQIYQTYVFDWLARAEELTNLYPNFGLSTLDFKHLRHLVVHDSDLYKTIMYSIRNIENAYWDFTLYNAYWDEYFGREGYEADGEILSTLLSIKRDWYL